MLPTDIVLGLALRFSFVPASRKEECRNLLKGAQDYAGLTERLRSAGLVSDENAAALWKKLELFERARSVIAYLEQQRVSVPPVVLKKYIDRLAADNVEVEVILKEEGIALPWETQEAAAMPDDNNGIVLFEEEILEFDYALAATPMLTLAGYPELELPDPPPEEAIIPAAPPAEEAAPAPAEPAAAETPSEPDLLEDDLIRALGVEPPVEAPEDKSTVSEEIDRALEGDSFLREELGQVLAGQAEEAAPPAEPPAGNPEIDRALSSDGTPPPGEVTAPPESYPDVLSEPPPDVADPGPPPPPDEPETADLDDEISRVLGEKPPEDEKKRKSPPK